MAPESGPGLFLNRELSWLAFNRRVLEEALEAGLPPLERLRFLAITASNLDEFFMVRVGGLQELTEQGITRPDPAGLTPAAQLKEIDRQARQMVADQQACLAEVEASLREGGIRREAVGELVDPDLDFLERLFTGEIFPVVTPVAFSADRPLPLLPGLRLNVLFRFKQPPGAKGKEGGQEKDEGRQAVVALPPVLARFITLPADKGHRYILLEDVVARFADRLFPGETLLEAVAFRITRNADLEIREDQAADLLEEMKEVLVERKQSACVRLEVAGTASGPAVDTLRAALDIAPGRVVKVPGPLDLSAFLRLAVRPGFESLKNEPWPPQGVEGLEGPDSVFDAVGRRDFLLFHPYESFDPVERLVETAAEDGGVLAVKQILYRTSENSPIVAALVKAAGKDKHVTALVELKARFDEARNIEGALELERAGAQVIYGLRGLKTHAKVCLIVRREPSGLRRYVHFGTGNYNEKTARLYSDVGLLTADEDYAADATAFFNMITGFSQPVRFRKIEAAPLGLKARLLELIDNETRRQAQGQKGWIRAKVNSLAEPDVIRALYRASQAGVRVDLNVRGICCLRPGVKGLSENITVVSIIDRFLEHSRILYFHNGGEARVFISSADWMARNLERRVELLVQVEDEACRARLIGLLDVFFRDNVKARRLGPDGTYVKVERAEGVKKVRAQEYFYEQAREAALRSQKSRAGEFEPVRPPSQS
jgi:polyphosphate kinase